MAREPRLRPARPGQKRPRSTAILGPRSAVEPSRGGCAWLARSQHRRLPALCSHPLSEANQGEALGKIRRGLFRSSGHCDLNYKLYGEDVPYRVYENQRIPPLINHVPVRIRRTHAGMGVKGSFGPHKASRNGPLPPRRIQPQTGELHSIREELSQIKAQVDSLLQSLERMDPQRHQSAGTTDSEETRGPGSESAWCRGTENQWEPRGQRPGAQRDSAKAGTSTEQAVKNHTSDQEGSE